ncbi:hypothetical protein DINM_002789 [Dirofilaria immitis]|nr:hypothetical protein [Dirofilaria immitis]
MSWIVPSTNVNQRMRHIEEILDSIPYFFNSMLDDSNLQKQLLVELDNISSKTLKIWNEKDITLHQYIKMRLLKTIERPWEIIPEQLTEKMPNALYHAFPINEKTFPLGNLSQKILNFDHKRWISVIELNIIDCNNDELKCLIAEANKRRRFGSVRIWRLWGVCQHISGNVSLILEDIIYGSVADFLCKFAVHIADGLRNLEKYGFIHRRLSIDVCLLTYNYNVKIAIYGLTPGELYPTYLDLDDVDHCRWLPPECLPNLDSTPISYNASGMIYSFGIILWSIFHGGILPFEDEPADNIRNRQYRIQNPLYIEPELVPNKIRDVS